MRISIGSIFKFLKERAWEIGEDVGIFALLKHFWKRAGAEAANGGVGAFKRRFVTNQRQQLTLDVKLAEAEDLAELQGYWAEFDEATSKNQEERFVSLICKLLYSRVGQFDGGKGEQASSLPGVVSRSSDEDHYLTQEERVGLLRWFSDLSPEDRKRILYQLEHDALGQVLKRAWARVRAMVSEAHLRSVRLWLKDAWVAGNDWMRFAIVLIFVEPIFPALASLTGSMTATAISTLIGLVLPAALLLSWANFDPLILAVIGTVEEGREILRRLALLLALELGVGAYFTLVPMANDPGLLPVIILFFLIGVLVFAGKGPRVAQYVAFGIVALATVAILLGGRQKIGDTVSGWLKMKPDTTALNKQPAAAAFVPSAVPQASQFNGTCPADSFEAQAEFRVDSGQVVRTVWLERGVSYFVSANHPWEDLAGHAPPDTSHTVYRLNGETIPVSGLAECDKLLVRGTRNGTVIKFARRS